MASGLTQLHQFIVAHYSLDELRTLCFDLGVNYDDLGGEALSGKARELILKLGRERKLEELLIHLGYDAKCLEGELKGFKESRIQGAAELNVPAGG